MKIFQAVAMTAATTSALVLGALTPAAHAETSPAAAAAIVEATLATEGVVDANPGVVSDLAESVEAAAEAGVIDEAVIDLAEIEAQESEDESSTPTPSPTESPSETPAEDATGTSELEDSLESREDEELDRWGEIGPLVQAAFDEVRLAFDACRAEQEVSTCARSLGAQFQLALTEVKLSVLEEQMAAVASLPTEEQAPALAELEAVRAELLDRLARNQAKLLDRGIEIDPAVDERVAAVFAQYGLSADEAIAAAQRDARAKAAEKSATAAAKAADKAAQQAEKANEEAKKAAASGDEVTRKAAEEAQKAAEKAAQDAEKAAKDAEKAAKDAAKDAEKSAKDAEKGKP